MTVRACAHPPRAEPRPAAAPLSTRIDAGVTELPIMPYHSYGKLTDGDARALAGYLKSLKPVRNQVPGPVGANEKPSAPYLTVVMPQ